MKGDIQLYTMLGVLAAIPMAMISPVMCSIWLGVLALLLGWNR